MRITYLTLVPGTAETGTIGSSYRSVIVNITRAAPRVADASRYACAWENTLHNKK